MTRDDDLEKQVEKLQRSLEELRREIEPRPPRGPGGLPRPPTPRELMRFADRQAIPTAIAVLEANVRTLELLQAALRLADPERAAAEEADRTRARTEELSRRSLDRLDSVLRDLQEATRGDTLPPNSDAREILEEARRLGAEISDGIDGAERVRTGERQERSSEEAEGEEGVEIDVEDELDSIRAELEDAENASDEESENADEED